MQPYQGIAHIDRVRQYSEDADGEIMLALGRVLSDAGIGEVLGVSLLHEHYRLEDREYWLERAEGNLVVSRPVAHAASGGAMHPMIWRLMPGGFALPMHWRAGVDEHAERISAFLYSATPRLLEVLGNEADRFGIIRAPSYPEFGRGLNLREVSYADQRVLVSDWSDTLGEGTVQTAWYFQAPASQVCVPITRTFCRAFCLKTRDGHNRSHSREPLPAGHES